MIAQYQEAGIALKGFSLGNLRVAYAAANSEDLAFMKRIDELHLEDPTLGTRRFSKILTREGTPIGRTRVARLMRIMRITAIYRAPRKTIADPLKYKSSVFAEKTSDSSS